MKNGQCGSQAGSICGRRAIATFVFVLAGDPESGNCRRSLIG
jgi:hypothetical protein